MTHTPAIETQVNSYTTSSQNNAVTVPLDGGGWVVVWVSTGQNNGYSGIYQRVYAADGSTQGDDVQVNTYSENAQTEPALTKLQSGGWVVTWTSQNQDGDSLGIYQQAYHANGTPMGDETPVNTTTLSDQSQSQVTALADGGWVTSWIGSDGSGGWMVSQQAFEADGTPRGDETSFGSLISSFTSHSMTVLADGGWLVTWRDAHVFGDSDIHQQAFNADGTARGDETIANPSTAGVQDFPLVTALTDGGWVVSWTNDDYSIHQQAYNGDGTTRGSETAFANTSGYALPYNAGSWDVEALPGGGWVITRIRTEIFNSGAQIRQQVYDADGNAVGDQIRIDDGRSTEKANIDITMLHDGGWVVTWQSTDVNGTLQNIYQHAFNADGTDRGGAAIVNTYTINPQTDPHVTALADGGWIVTWSSIDADGDSTGVFQQRYNSAGQVYGTNLAPTAANNTVTVLEDGSHTFSVADFGYSDSTDGDALAYVMLLSIPTSGTLLLDGEVVFANQGIDAGDIDKLVWKPDADMHGSAIATLTFKVIDDGGTERGGKNTSTVHTMTLDVASVNDAPVAADGTINLLEDQSYTFSQSDFGFSDPVDGDQFKSVQIRSIITVGTLTLDGAVIGKGASIDVADLSKLVWTPPTDASGDGLFTLNFDVTDDGGTANGGNDTSDTFALTFNVTAVNDAPTGADKTVTIKEDTRYAFKSGDFGFSDSGGESNQFAGIKIATLPSSGKLTLDGHAVARNDVIAKADVSKLVWTPAKDAFGNDLGHFTFKVMDDGGTANGGKNIAAIANTFTFNVTDVTDVFRGDAGRNVLKGTAGHDLLDGKGGNDTLTGRAGSDTFVFGKNYGRDTITDFAATGKDHDIIDLTKMKSITDFADLKANHMSTHGHDVWIDGGKGDVLVLKDADLHDLGKGDFIF